jgi:hypothetical protein
MGRWIVIISHSLYYVYVGPPKTASTAVHRWLKQEALFDVSRDIDTTADGHQHDYLVPIECANYFKFATTRNYDDWLDSLWRQSRNDSIDYPDKPLLSWVEFLGWRKTCDNAFYYRELEEYFAGGMDQLIRMEHLEEDLKRLPFASPLWNYLVAIEVFNVNHRSPKVVTLKEKN